MDSDVTVYDAVKLSFVALGNDNIAAGVAVKCSLQLCWVTILPQVSSFLHRCVGTAAVECARVAGVRSKFSVQLQRDGEGGVYELQVSGASSLHSCIGMAKVECASCRCQYQVLCTVA